MILRQSLVCPSPRTLPNENDFIFSLFTGMIITIAYPTTMLQVMISAQHRTTFSLLLAVIVETFVMEWKSPIQLWATAVVVNQAILWPVSRLILAIRQMTKRDVSFAVHKVLLTKLMNVQIVQVVSNLLVRDLAERLHASTRQLPVQLSPMLLPAFKRIQTTVETVASHNAANTSFIT